MRDILLTIYILVLFSVKIQAQGWQSNIVHYDSLGKLVYVTDGSANRIPDFSHAGYKGGGVELPIVSTVRTISPVAGDNTANIQNAINQVGGLPLNSEGIRGALLLLPGKYRVSGTINVNFDGVTLRGSGQGSDSLTNTIILGTGNTPAERDIILAGGGSNTKWSGQVSNTKTNITDDTVHIGSYTFTVVDASAYAFGDNIVIYHPCTDLWLQAVEYGGTNGTEQWTIDSQPLVFNRFITSIVGNTITVDVPLFNNLVKSLSQSFIYKYNRSGLKKNIGVENLRVDMTGWEPDTLAQESSAWTAIALSQLEDSWVKNCTATHFVYACVRTETATRITVDSCNGINPIGSVLGSDPNHRRYTFALDDASQQVLMQNCLATNGRHSFMSNGTSWTSGCVFYNVKVLNPFAPSEPHRRWSMGILYDNFKQLNGPLPGYSSELLGFYNRGDMGTGHGWAAANCVAWNCNIGGGDLLVQRPPTAQNYAIGCFGNHVTGAAPPAPFNKPVGYIEGTNVANLNPPSLYMAQLQERLGVKFALKSGNWSDPTTWNNGVLPTNLDDVVITTGDTVTVNIANAQCKNLTIDGMLLFPNNVNTMGITINGSLTIDTLGTFKTVAQTSNSTALTHTILLYGDLVSQGGTFDMRAGSGSSASSNTICAANITFAGSVNAIIKVGTYSSSNNEFNAITFDKSGGAKVTLQSDVSTNTSSTVAGAFITLSNGIVETGNNTLIALATNSSGVTGGSTTSYVNGNLGRSKSSTAGSLVYPIGDSSGYRPFTVYTSTAGLTTKHYLTVRVIHARANTGSSIFSGGIDAVSPIRYYKITYNKSASTSDSMKFYKFSPSYGNDDSVTVGLQNLRVATSNDNRVTWTSNGPTNHTTTLVIPPTTINSDSITSGLITLTDQRSFYTCLAYIYIAPPSALTLLSPVNAETLLTISPRVTWAKGSSDVTLYWVEYATDSLFTHPLIDSTIVDTTKLLSQLKDRQTYWWRVKAKGTAGWGSFSAIWKFTCLISIHINHEMNSGWNLISIPAQVPDSRKLSLFPHSVSNAFSYKNGYVVEDTLRCGSGYWLKFISDTSTSIFGIPLAQETLLVKKGWNLVGSISIPFSVQSVISMPNGNISSAWFGFNNGYVSADTLKPFNGYWVKADTTGMVILQPTAQVKIHSKSIELKK